MDPYVYTVLGTILGVCLAGPITYHYSKRLIRQTHKNTLEALKRQEFNKAAATFQNAFLPEISYLEYGIPLESTASTDQSIKWFLRTGLSRHIEALCVFKAYLSNDERSSINKAWDKYRNQSDSYDSKPMPDEEKRAALQEIHSILNEFASFR